MDDFKKVFYVFIILCLLRENAPAQELLPDNKLLTAASRGELAAVKRAYQEGANIDARDKFGNTALLLAADGGYKDVVIYLLSEDADVNAQNIFGYTPIFNAVSNYDKKISDILIKKGADPSIINKYGTSPNMFIKAKGFNSIEDFIKSNDNKAGFEQKRGASLGLHNSIWREKYNRLLSENKKNEAEDYLMNTAREGNLEAMAVLGTEKLKSGEKEDGIDWLTKASKGADKDLLYYIGYALVGDAAVYDREFGLSCLKNAAEKGSLAAFLLYPRLLYKYGFFKEAYPFFASSAKDGNKEGKYYSGRMMYEGKGTEENKEAGLLLIKEAASENYREAKKFLGRFDIEDIIKRASLTKVADRAAFRAEITGRSVPFITENENCDKYGFKETFYGAYGIDSMEVCYPGDGSVRTSFYYNSSADSKDMNRLKAISDNSEFVLSKGD